MIQNQPDLDHVQLVAKINTFIEYEFIIAIGITTFSQFLGTFLELEFLLKGLLMLLKQNMMTF